MRPLGTHRHVRHGDDRIVLQDNRTATAVVTADREGDTWRLKVEGAEDRTVPAGSSKDAVIHAMNIWAYELAPEQVGPDGQVIKNVVIVEPIREMPDKTMLHIRDEH